jgi:hypothetical protein
MNRILTIVCLALSASLAGCGPSPISPEGPLGSKTDTLTWEFINSMNTQIDLRFFDINYGAWYPSRSHVYVLEPGDDKTYRLDCNKGATICYGASVRSNHNQFWGRSVDNDQSCGSQGCCHTCDGATLTAISLTSR